MLRRSRSIVGRIIGLHILAIGITCAVLPLVVYLLLSATATNFENQVLRDHARLLSSYLQFKDQSWHLDMPTDMRTLYAHGYGGFAFAVMDATGKTLFSSLPGQTPIHASDVRGPQASYFQLRQGKAAYYGITLPVRSGEHAVWLQVAQNLEHPDMIVDDIVAHFLSRIGWFTVPLLLWLLVTDIIIVRQALRPVVEASQMARSIDPERMDVRLPTQDLPREILPLTMAVNQALDRLERGFIRQREFTADAAHELRTPLTVLTMRIDTLPDQEVTRLLRADIAAMNRVVKQLLEIAELESFGVKIQPSMDVQAVCTEVVMLIAPIALAQGKEIALTGEPGPVLIKGDPEVLFQAVRNLAENAVHHTAPGTAVEIEVDSSGAIRVLDCGPGVPESARESIFRRFWRGDRTHTGGAGLGLAIVARIARAHGGSITVSDRPGGGAVFTLTLPLAEV